MVTLKRLKEVLTYDKDTGIFRWSKTRRGVKKGKIAGCVNPKGYRQIKVDGVLYKAHRLAWLYVHGEFPVNGIDHVNGNKDDNRISNLRDVDQRVNGQNQVRHRNGKLVGCCYYKHAGKWKAQIQIDGKHQYLGLYDTEQEAHEVYMKALITYEKHPRF